MDSSASLDFLIRDPETKWTQMTTEEKPLMGTGLDDLNDINVASLVGYRDLLQQQRQTSNQSNGQNVDQSNIISSTISSPSCSWQLPILDEQQHQSQSKTSRTKVIKKSFYKCEWDMCVRVFVSLEDLRTHVLDVHVYGIDSVDKENPGKMSVETLEANEQPIEQVNPIETIDQNKIVEDELLCHMSHNHESSNIKSLKPSQQLLIVDSASNEQSMGEMDSDGEQLHQSEHQQSSYELNRSTNESKSMNPNVMILRPYMCLHCDDSFEKVDCLRKHFEVFHTTKTGEKSETNFYDHSMIEMDSDEKSSKKMNLNNADLDKHSNSKVGDRTDSDGTDSDVTDSDGSSSDGSNSDESNSDGSSSDGSSSDGSSSNGSFSDGSSSDGTDSDEESSEKMNLNNADLDEHSNSKVGDGTNSVGTNSDVTDSDGSSSDGSSSDGSSSDGTDSDEESSEEMNLNNADLDENSNSKVGDGRDSDGTDSDGSDSHRTDSDWTNSDGTDSDGMEIDEHPQKRLVHQVTKSNKSTNQSSFSCPECGKLCKNKKAFSDHLLKRHPKQMFCCRVSGCGKWCKTLGDMLSHYLHSKAHKKANLPCDKCKKFGINNDFKLHLETHHSICFERKQPTHQNTESTSQSSFNCPECGNSFISEYSVNLHRKSVHPKKLFYCRVSGCGMSFKKCDHLLIHYRHKTAHKKTNLPCDKCKMFGKNKDFKAHLRTRHSIYFDQANKLNDSKRTKSSVKCHKCGKYFGNKKAVKRHLRIFHAKKKFHCRVSDKCDKSFKSVNNMMSHYLHTKVHEKDNIPCDQCKKFKINRDFQAHLQTHHSICFVSH